MKAIYQNPCLEIILLDLDIITSSGEGTIEDDAQHFNPGWVSGLISKE